MTTTDLSERETQALEYLRKAQELGTTLTEYCAAFGVEVKELYALKQQLVRKGILPAGTRPKQPIPPTPLSPYGWCRRYRRVVVAQRSVWCTRAAG